MSSNVDNRIVRMTFDNAKFEQGIKNTMDTLTKFEQKLKFSDSSKGFEEITRAANKLNLSGLDKSIDNTSRKMSNMASEAKSSLNAMQKSLDNADFSKMGDSAGKASDAINKALASINFDDLDKKSQETLRSMMNSAGQIDFSSITDAAGKVDFSSLSDNAAIAIGAVMDLAGDVNFNGIAQNAELAMSDVNAAIEKVEFSSLGVEATEAIGDVNKAADSTDMSGVSNAAWTAAVDTNNAISNIDMHSLVEATDEAAQGFSTLETIAVGALLNIGGQIESFFLGKIKGLAGAITEPITQGFQEYQTQMGAIQTILANTGRSFESDADIAEVNSVLDELNTYADKTIYNFTEMVKNIGMFTAAGTDLYDASDAIKGLSNLAAIQGADPTSAARAMYQMSQAMASGTVRLMDWKSLDNASMGGQIFKDVVLNAAEKMYGLQNDEKNIKTVQQIKSGELSFNESLEEKWLTSDILLESFVQLTYAFGDLDDQTKNLTETERQELEAKKKEAEDRLKTLGYTKDEIEAVFELGQKAQDSATKVRTVTQLFDSLKEALGSGWTETWRIILGDFKEATDTLTKLNEALTKVIGIWDGARNSLLGEWANLGGRFTLFGGTRQIYKKDANGNVMTDENGDPVYEDQGIEYIGAFDYILDAVKKPLQALHDAFSEVFNEFFTADALMDITEGFRDFTEGLVLSDTAAEGLKGVLTLLFEVIKAGLQIISHVISIGMDIVDVIRVVTDPLMDLVLLIAGDLAKGLAGIIENFLDAEGTFYDFAHGSLRELWDVLSTIVESIGEMVDIPGIIKLVGDAVYAFFEALTKFEGLGELLAGASQAISGFFYGVLEFFGLVPPIDSDESLITHFLKIKEGAETNLKKALDFIVNAIPGLKEFIDVMGGSDQQKKIEFFTNMFKQIGDVVMPIITAIATPIGLLAGALKTLWDVLINSEPIQNFITWLDQLKNSALAWLSSVPEKLKTFADTISQAFDVLTGKAEKWQVSDKAREMIDAIGEIDATTPFKLLGGGIALGIQAIGETIRNGFETIHEFLLGWVDDTPEEFVSNLSSSLLKIEELFQTPLSGIEEFAKSILPDDMTNDIDNWFTSTSSSLTNGFNSLISWINETTSNSNTATDAVLSIIGSGWDTVINAITNFDPQEAINAILTTLDNIKTGLFSATGGILDYIFGFGSSNETDRSLGSNSFTFTSFFENLGDSISDGIEKARKTIDKLFTKKDGTVFEKITEYFVGDKKDSKSLKTQMKTLSKNLNEGARTTVADITKTITDPSLSFTKISSFISEHTKDITAPFEKIADFFDTTLFPNTDRSFSEGLEKIKETASKLFEDIHGTLEEVFSESDDWPSFFKELFEKISETIGEGVGSIVEFFKDDNLDFEKIFDTIGTGIEDFINGIKEKFPALGTIFDGVATALEPIVSTITGIIEGISDATLSAADIIKGVSDILQNGLTAIPTAIFSIWNGTLTNFTDLFDSFLTGVNERVPGAKSSVENFFTSILSVFGVFNTDVDNSTRSTVGSMNNLIDGIESVGDQVNNSPLLDNFSGFFTKLCEALNLDNLERAAGVFETVASGLLLVSISTFVKKMTKLTPVLGNLGQSIADAIKNFQNPTEAKKPFTEGVKDMSEAILMIAGAIWVLSTIEQDDMDRALEALKIIALALAGLETVNYIIARLADKHDIKAFANVKEQAKEIAAISAALLAINEMEEDDFYDAAKKLAAMKAAITLIDVLGNIAIAIVAGGKGLTAFQPLQNSVTEIISFAGALGILALIPETEMEKALRALGELMGILVVFELVSGLLSRFFEGNDPEKVIEKFSTVAIKFGIAVAIMAAGFSLTKDVSEENLRTVEAGIGILLTIFGLFVYFGAEKADAAVKISKSLVIASASVLEICLGLSMLEGMDTETLKVAEAGIAIILGIIGAINLAGSKIAEVGPMLATGGAFAIAAFGVLEICSGLALLKDLSNVQIDAAAMAIQGTLFIIGLFNNAGSAIGKIGPMLASGGAYAIACFGVIEICNGMSQLRDLSDVQIEAAGTVMTGMLGVIGLFNTVSAANVTKIGPLLASGGAFALACFGVIEICNGMADLQNLTDVQITAAGDAIAGMLLIIGLFDTAAAASITTIGPLLASGGAFAIACAGVIEICNGMSQLQDMTDVQIEAAGKAIDGILFILGLINTAGAIIDNVWQKVATGGAFALAAFGVIEICTGLKQLEGLDPETIKTGAEAIDSIIIVLGAVGAFLSLPIFEAGALTLVAIAAGVYMIAEGFKAFAEGIRAWLELARDLPQLLKDAKEGLDELGKMLKQWWDDTLGPALGDALANVIKWWNDEALPAIINWGLALPGILGKIVEDLVNWVTTEGWPKLVELANSLKDSVGKFLEENLPKVGQAIQDGLNGIGKWFEDRWKDAKKFVTEDIPKMLGEFIESAGKFFEDLHLKVTNGIADIANAVIDWFTKDVPKWWGEQIDSLKKGFDDGWKDLEKKVAEQWDKWCKETEEYWDGVLKWWANLPDNIMKAIGDLTKTGEEIVNGILIGIGKAVQSNAFVNGIMDFGSTIKQYIDGFFEINSPSKLMRDTVGKSIPEGIGVGITKYAKLTKKPVIKMGRATLKAVTDYFDIHSPSRLMRDRVGRYIPEGLAAGMDAYSVIAVDSAESLGSSISQAVYSGLGDISGSQYGYGISPVIDIETLKTDIEVLHEMLRVKIDDVSTLLHTKIDEVLEAFENFILEQLQAKLETDDEIFNERLEGVKEYIQTELKEYVETKMQELNTQLGQVQEGLTQAIPEMTNQIIGQFETTNQSLSAILEAMNSEERSAVNDAITGPILEKLDKISQSLGETWEGGQTIDPETHKYVTNGKQVGIIDVLQSIYENLFRDVDDAVQVAMREYFDAAGGGSIRGSQIFYDKDSGTLAEMMGKITHSLQNEDMGIGEMIHSLLDGLIEDHQTESIYSILNDGISALIGDGGTSNGKSIYDMIKSMEYALYIDDTPITEIIHYTLEEQKSIHKYLEDILGSVEEGNGTLVEQLEAAITNGEKIDNNTDAVQEANEERERAEIFTKNAIQNLQDSLNKQRYETNWNDAMGLGLTQEARQSLQGDTTFTNGQKYVM